MAPGCSTDVIGVRLVTSLVHLMMVVQSTSAFNLDATRANVLSGPADSYFGYAVDFYLPGSDSVSVVIGAPRANTTQPGVVEGGAVYNCPWAGDADCTTVKFDTKGDRMITLPTEAREKLEYKSKQWFGASLRTHGSKVLACAPLYHWRTMKTNREKDPVGTCYLSSDNFNKFSEYSPCRTSFGDPQGQGFCQGGFSVDFTKSGRVVLGGPGSFYWQGQLITAPSEAVMKDPTSESMVRSIEGQKQTGSAPPSYDDSYLGYSVTVGEFTGDNQQDFVTGVPKGFRTLGYVGILDGENMTSLHNFSGEQMASYFGFSVAVTDVNGDKLEDVLVGAPLFMDRGSDGKLREVGRVYLFLQERTLSFREPQRFTGEEMYSRFGSALAPLGDVDQDGFNDVAVGIPFGGENRQGLVYIYNGDKDGLKPVPSQVLESRWPGTSMPSSFGYALRGTVDVDKNGYPDLVVGAFGASKAIVYRARPVVTVEAELQLEPQIINLESKDCKQAGSTSSFACFTVNYCVQVVGKGALSSTELNLELQLDRLKQKGTIKRALFALTQQSRYEQRITINKGEGPTCNKLTVYLRDETEFRDKLTPIAVSLNYTLMEEATSASQGLRPIRNHFSPDHIQKQAHILLDCGSDNICVPSLKLSALSDRKQLYIGDENSLVLTVNSRNDGEGAYEAELHVVLPPEADYVGVVRNNESLAKLTCAYKTENLTRSVVCDLGNPMRGGTNLLVGLRFSVQRLEEAVSPIQFSLHIKSSNEKSPESNTETVVLPVGVFAQVNLVGVSIPDQIVLPIINWEPVENPVKEEDIGPLVQHVYELRNIGPSRVGSAEMDLSWPLRSDDDYILYVLALNTEGPIKCVPDSSNKINPLNLKLSNSHDTPGANETGNQLKENPRDIHRRELQSGDADSKSPRTLNCSTAECLHIRCTVQTLESGHNAVLQIKSRLWAKAFMEKESQQHTIESAAHFSVNDMPYKIRPEKLPSGAFQVSTIVAWANQDGNQPVPVWVIIVAVLAGLLLLSLLVFAMWKMGFFKRVRPPQEDNGEEQQLHTEENGGDHADA
ncbi:integrin alpha-8-like [Lampetra fluviatilis]